MVFACCADINWDIAKEPQDSLGVHINHLRFGKDFYIMGGCFNVFNELCNNGG